MSEVKKRMSDIIMKQPDDSSYEELRELAFERMIERGMLDSRNNRVHSNEEIQRRIRSWQK